MYEILALLLPLAAVSGWYAAVKHMQRQSANNLNRRNHAYFQGLNHLLSERPDKALDVFVYLLEEGSETVETHLTLGSLFRRRGEVDRAIAIHKRLLDRTGLNDDDHQHVHYELAMDYMGAGLYDRAESLFMDLIDGSYEKSAIEQLLNIYQQEKDWLSAIQFKRKLDLVGEIPRGESVAQFYCELALESFHQGDIGKAHGFIDSALKEDSSCVRASLIEANISISQSLYFEALESLKRVENQNPAYLTEVLSPLANCFDKLQKSDEKINYLKHLHSQFSVPEITAQIAALLENKDGNKKAIEFLFETLDDKASIQGMNALISRLVASSNGENKKILSKLREFSTKLMSSQAMYRCERCGFSGKEIHWRCPGCNHWETIKPVALDF